MSQTQSEFGSAAAAFRTSLIESELFDAAWYVARYPDVSEFKGDPVDHFISVGMGQGRSPGPNFDSEWYLNQYPDVRSAGRDPLDHYLQCGKAEGRAASPRNLQDRAALLEKSGLFDESWYLNRYPEVRQSGLSPMQHFLTIGSLQGMSPGPSFDSEWYLSNYPDVRSAGLEPVFHYLNSGKAEGRMTSQRAPQDLVANYWATNRKMERPLSWAEHPVLLDFLNMRISGDPKVDACEWIKRSYFPQPVPLALSLGCGIGGFERRAIQSGIASTFHASDIAPGAIETARRLARESEIGDRIVYSVADLEKIVFPTQTYDAIFAISSAHHVFHLERLFDQCRKALKPGGILFLDEYIGPTRFQSSELVTSLINTILGILPPRYRRNLLTNDGRLVDRYVPQPLVEFERTDPSEAIRSGEIVSILKLYFDIVEMRPYGGTILHMLLSGIIGNFDEGDEVDVALLRVLASFEEILEKERVFLPDFAVIVAKPK